MSYRVLVDDNFDYMDESRRSAQGTYATYAEALAVCHRIVEASLLQGFKPGTTAEALYAGYTAFGDDPFIVNDGDSPEVRPFFSAWDYAKARCEQLCAGPRPAP